VSTRENENQLLTEKREGKISNQLEIHTKLLFVRILLPLYRFILLLYLFHFRLITVILLLGGLCLLLKKQTEKREEEKTGLKK
jgi:predicted membrane protein